MPLLSICNFPEKNEVALRFLIILYFRDEFVKTANPGLCNMVSMNILFVTVTFVVIFHAGTRVADISSFRRVRQVHGRYFRQRVQNGIEAEAKESRGAGRSQPAK